MIAYVPADEAAADGPHATTNSVARRAAAAAHHVTEASIADGPPIPPPPPHPPEARIQQAGAADSDGSLAELIALAAKKKRLVIQPLETDEPRAFSASPPLGQVPMCPGSRISPQLPVSVLFPNP